MAYSLEEINYQTVADPKGMIEEADALYAEKVETTAQMILENRKNSPIVLLSGPSGLSAIVIPRSSFSSLSMFTSEGGSVTPSRTLKARP